MQWPSRQVSKQDLAPHQHFNQSRGPTWFCKLTLSKKWPTIFCCCCVPLDWTQSAASPVAQWIEETRGQPRTQFLPAGWPGAMSMWLVQLMLFLEIPWLSCLSSSQVAPEHSNPNFVSPTNARIFGEAIAWHAMLLRLPVHSFLHTFQQTYQSNQISIPFSQRKEIDCKIEGPDAIPPIKSFSQPAGLASCSFCLACSTFCTFSICCKIRVQIVAQEEKIWLPCHRSFRTWRIDTRWCKYIPA